ncbi:MAG: S-adenosyl-l-methionine hydroxide adenosyltransferase family protein [Candidatus Bathyarchaeota archaeon]|nr:S-adenosyl-l-methionine hydroxide adenosyltransferase family protein [Candidatus Bathyarchaeota archaeon]MDW8040257.1 SAM-dependent chlorinase/fluorinase [Nitrososphaerota archaeon]
MKPPISIITLTTDFGLADPYVAEMKAVILGINPTAKIVDVTHQVEKFNIRHGAFILAAAAPYFPKNTIHVAVVDPGVGTKRKPILIETEKYFFVGPDNGVLTLAARKQGIRHIYEIVNPKVMLPRISQTFHGRDIFAPAAAYLSRGVKPLEFGPKIRRIVMPRFARVIGKGSTLMGEVIHVDSFGNIITNFTAKNLEDLGIQDFVRIKLKDKELTLKLCKAYAEVETGKPLAIIGSHDFLEVSVNMGNAAQAFGVKIGDTVKLCRSS